MQISKSVEYKNIHIRIFFRVEVSHNYVNLCTRTLKVFYLFANQTFCWLIKLNHVVLSRVVYQFVFLALRLF